MATTIPWCSPTRPTTRPSVDKIRKRGRGLHAARDRLAAPPDKIDAGMTSDAIANELTAVGWALIITP